MKIRKTILDDGFQAYLTKGANLVGKPGIPELMDIKNVQTPRSMIPYGKAKACKNHRQFVHFYQHDKEFSRVLTATWKYLELLKLYDGVITPDCSILIGQAPCLQQANIYMSRAVGFYFQKNAIPVIPNVRWGDESTYDFCFLGIPKNSPVCISTHGCLKDKGLRTVFKSGLQPMLDILSPSVILVHGHMPEDVFSDYSDKAKFIRYPSEFEATHPKRGA